MSKVQELEKEIEKLSPGEAGELRDWFLERDWDLWDRQIERDEAEGKLDRVFKKSLENHEAGKSKVI